MKKTVVSRKFDCFEEFAHSAHAWQLDFRPLSKSEGKTKGTQISVGDMLIRKTRNGCYLDQHGLSPEGMYAFDYLPLNSTPMYWNGFDVEPGHMILYGQERTVNAITRPRFKVTSFCIPKLVFDDWVERHKALNYEPIDLREDKVIRLTDLQMEKLDSIFKQAKQLALRKGPFKDEFILRESFLTVIHDIFSTPLNSRILLLPKKRQLLNEVLGFCRRRSTRKMTVTGVCQEFDISERWLQQLFKSEIGDITPKSYMLAQRLYMAYRLLRNIPNTVGGVSYVAAELEFNNFSKFTQSYQKLIGELPSDTLKRPSLSSLGDIWDA